MLILADDIEDRLKAKGWTTYRLAKDNHLSQSTYSRIKKGLPINWPTLARLCDLLECQPGELIRWEPDQETERHKRHMG